MPKQTRRKRYQAKPSTSRGKGDILEAAVASLHEAPGLSVQRDVFLPSLDGSERTREIDVLISTQVAGYPVRVAVECKNEKQPVGPTRIDEFIGKLDDVGIPRQHGVFVTPTRFTAGGLKRAKAAFIETLLFKDLTEALPAAVATAFQSVVYLLLSISNIVVRNDRPGPAMAGEILFFRDSAGNVAGSVADLVWQMWTRGETPSTLGTHNLSIPLLSDWHQIVHGQEATVQGIQVDVVVSAHVVTFSGTVKAAALIKPESHEASKISLHATYPKPQGTFPVVSFDQEPELENWLSSRGGIGVTISRIRLPRIRWMALYWPPSDKAMATLFQLFLKSLEDGRLFDVASVRLEDIEGSDLGTIWEPITRTHPLLKGPSPNTAA